MSATILKKFVKSAPTLTEELRPFAENLAALASNAELLAAGTQKSGVRSCGEIGLSLSVSLLNEKARKAWMCSQTLLALAKDALASAEIERNKLKITEDRDSELIPLHSYFSGLVFSLKHVESSLRRFVAFHEEAKKGYAAARKKCDELLEKDASIKESKNKERPATKRSLGFLGSVCGSTATLFLSGPSYANAMIGGVVGGVVGAALGALSDQVRELSPEEKAAIAESRGNEIDMATVAQVAESMVKMKEVLESTEKALEQFEKCTTMFGQIFDFFLDENKPLEAEIGPANGRVNKENHLSQSSDDVDTCFENGVCKRAKYDHGIEVTSSDQTNHPYHCHTNTQTVTTINGDSLPTIQVENHDTESQFPTLFDKFLSEVKRAQEILISCEKDLKLHKNN